MILTERRSIERWLEVILDDCTRDICRALAAQEQICPLNDAHKIAIIPDLIRNHGSG
jgi:hypothetical protein